MKLNILIESFIKTMLIIIIWFSIIIIFVLNNLWWNLSFFSTYIDKLYDYNIIWKIIKDNIPIFLPFIWSYIIFIWYISLKKWLSITEWLNWSYFHVLWIIFRWINFVLLLFLVYLYNKSNYFELFIISVFSLFFLNIISSKIILTYNQTRNDYESLEIINSFKKWPLNVQDIIDAHKEVINWNINSLKVLATWILVYFQYFSWISFIISILAFPIWILLKFNLITIIYFHISFILIYISFNLISNLFPWYVRIRYWNKNINWFLLEKTKDKLILLTKKETLVFDASKIDYIKINKK